MKKVVGTMFFKDKHLLIDKPRKRNTFQMVGGSVEDFESIIDAAYRECVDELGSNVVLDKTKFKQVLDFDEIATSDQKTKIHFFVFEYLGELKGDLQLSEEIESFLWYDTSKGTDILSNTLKNEVIPYCLKNNKIN